MSENTSLSVVGFVALASALASTAVLSMHFGRIPGDKVLEHVFAAAVEVFLGVCVAGGVIWWYQRRQALRAEKTGLVRDLVDIREQVLAAAFLMSSHQSGATWSQQLRILIAASARVEEVKHSIETLSDGARSMNAAGHLKNAQSALEELRTEYRQRHEDVDKDQTQFENDKKAGTNPNRDAHWLEMLSYLEKTQSLVLDERSQLLRELRDAAESIKGRSTSRIGIDERCPTPACS